MKTIVILMLIVEAAMFLVAIFAAVFTPNRGERHPIWTSIAISLIIVASAANMIGDHHAGQSGADILQGGAMVLIGMAIMTIMIALRQRRALD
ncbi:MAG TPA: hypothetical protein VFW39_07430 [Sphingomicrobium sp.]|nr:hypothetical protein [Sphingomicrobium sp.]